MHFKYKGLHYSLLSAALLTSGLATAAELKPLSDAEMAAETGQALFNLSYLAPGQTGNTNAGMGFYKLGVEAQLEINANIKKLQLGCGGANGAGNCDIDIDNLSLSGTSTTSDGRTASSAIITNPFIQFAIKNPTTASTRELAGVKLSAEAIQGLLTLGTENSSSTNGINSFSGYMVTQATTGTVTTAARATGSGLTQTNLGTVITGRARSSLGLINTSFTSTAYDLGLSAASGSLALPSQVISGRRINTANLTGTATVSGINLSGTINAGTGIGIPISGDLSGVINNLGVNVAVSENLGYIHKVNLNGTAAALSLQAQDILWPGAKSTAQRGWWLEFSDPIDIGDVTPQDPVVITDDVVKATLGKVSQYLTANPVNCGVFAITCLAGTINVRSVDLTGQFVPMNLSNLVLKNQDFVPNCYGGLTFC